MTKRLLKALKDQHVQSRLGEKKNVQLFLTRVYTVTEKVKKKWWISVDPYNIKKEEK